MFHQHCIKHFNNHFKEFDFDEQQMEVYNRIKMTETFRFIDWTNFSAENVTLPIDKIVASLLKERF